MAKLGNLYVSLVADLAAWSSGLGKARTDLNSFGAVVNRSLASIDKSIRGAGRGFKDLAGEIFSVRGAMTALIGTVGIGSIVAMGKQAVEAVGSLGELASQIGVATDTLQSFRYAATQVGVSQEEMDGSLSKLTKTIGLAATGNKAAIDSFNRFGIKILDAQGNVRSTDDVILDIAESIKALPDPAQRAAEAVAFFGKAGQKMLPFLQDGARGIEDLVTQAKNLGLVFDEETIRQADEAADKLATLSLVLKTQFQAALVEMAPLLTEVAGKMIEFAGAINRVFQDVAPDDEKGLDALIRKFDRLQDEQDKLIALRDQMIADKNDAGALTKWLDSLLPGQSIDDKINETKGKIAELDKVLADLQGRIDLKMLDKSNATEFAGDRHGKGVSNPTPTGGGKTEAEKNLDRLSDKLRDLRAQLIDLGNAGEDEAGLESILSGFDLSSKSAQDLAAQIKEVVAQINEKKKAQKDDAAEVAEYNKIIEEGTKSYNDRLQEAKQITESLRTPAEVYADTVAHLNELHRQGAIDATTWGRGLEKAKQDLDDSNEGVKKFKDAMTELGATWTSSFEDAALAMDDAGFSAKSLGDTLKGLLQDIERIIIRMSVTNPIGEGISGLDWGKLLGGGGSWQSNSGNPHAQGGGGGFFGWIGSLFSSVVGSIFHGGGTVGRSGVSRRAMPALAFADAPRLHSGLFNPGEYPAILNKDESVLTPEQLAAWGDRGGSGIDRVIINNYGNDKATATQRTGDDGMQEVEVTIGKMVARNIDNGGNVYQALQRRLGAQRVPTVQR